AAELAALGSDLIEAGDEAISDAIAHEAPDRATAEQVSARARASAKSALAALTFIAEESARGGGPADPADTTGTAEATPRETPAHAYSRLTSAALNAQRAALLEERAIGRYSSHALRAAELALDSHETRL